MRRTHRSGRAFRLTAEGTPLVIYVVAILLPPLAVLLKGKLVQALVNLVLTAFFWVPGVIHAILVINKADADRRHAELLAAARK